MCIIPLECKYGILIFQEQAICLNKEMTICRIETEGKISYLG